MDYQEERLLATLKKVRVVCHQSRRRVVKWVNLPYFTGHIPSNISILRVLIRQPHARGTRHFKLRGSFPSLGRTENVAFFEKRLIRRGASRPPQAGRTRRACRLPAALRWRQRTERATRRAVDDTWRAFGRHCQRHWRAACDDRSSWWSPPRRSPGATALAVGTRRPWTPRSAM